MKRVAQAAAILFVLSAWVEGLCQSETSLPDSRQGYVSNPSTTQSRKTRRWEALPDAPSANSKHRHPLPTLGDSGIKAASPGPASSLYEAGTQAEPRDFFDKYLYPSLLKRNSRHHPATSGSFIRRATDAASQILISHDDSGKSSLNNTYFPGALTSAIVQTASGPYWTRSASTPFNNFGSTLGSDMGLNVFHEFAPDIRQVITAHTPRFVSRIENHISQAR